MAGTDITRHPIHLGLNASATIQPEFTGAMDWYQDYAARHAADGAEGRLVGMHSFTQSWDIWEMHPNGSEVVICIAGAFRLLQEQPDGTTTTTELAAGEYAINEAGIWHTAEVDNKVTVLFITAGEGTQHRPR